MYDEAHDVRQELGPELEQRLDLRFVGRHELQDHDRDHDRQHAVAERLEPSPRHRGRVIGEAGRGDVRLGVTDNRSVTTAGSRRASTDEEIVEFLAQYPPRIAGHAQRLRQIMRKTVPSAMERIRPGWRLIGYDLPVTRQGTFFAWVWPETEHVHIGWEVGTLLTDPDGILHGAHLKLKKVRYLTFEPNDPIDSKHVIGFTRQAMSIASMSRDERQLLRLSRSGELAAL